MCIIPGGASQFLPIPSIIDPDKDIITSFCVAGLLEYLVN